MTLPAPTYDLMLLLDPQAEESARAKIVADSRGAIEGQGELVRHDKWGERPLTYPIEKRSSAEYHLMQFHAGSTELLSGLDRTLRITDGVLRFRIIKLDPGTPDPPSAPTARPVESETGPAPVAPQAAMEAPPEVAETPAVADQAPVEASEPEAAATEAAAPEADAPEADAPEADAAPPESA